MRKFLFCLTLLGFASPLLGQSNLQAGLFPAGSSTTSFQWTLGEVISGQFKELDGSGLTVGFLQPIHLNMSTDLNPVFQTADVEAFPIPAHTFLRIRFDQTSDWSMFLMDLRGRMLQSWRIHDQQVDISVAELLPGPYLLRVVDVNRRSKIIRFVKH